MGYGIKLPACVYSGIGSIGDMKTIVKQESAKKVLVFTDKGVAGAGLLQKLLTVLDEAGVSCRIFDDLRPEPSSSAWKLKGDCPEDLLRCRRILLAKHTALPHP